MEHYAIIGFGCAGFQALKAIRETGCNAAIDIYSDTALPPYNPMLTTYYVKGNIPYEGMFPFGGLEEIRSKYAFTLHAERPVTAVDARECAVCLGDGASERYDKLLISTGARAFVPPVDGLKNERVFSMRDVADAVRLSEALQTQSFRKVLVVGASMVGIKIVELLLERGIEVVFSDLADHIFPTAAFEATSERIEAYLRSKGVELRFGVEVQSVSERDGRAKILFSDGGASLLDAVVVCIGTRAATGIVDPAEIAINRGIVVDTQMRTSADRIYAAGDCCEGADLDLGTTRIIGLWANAGQQGTTAGRNMAGGYASYGGNILHNITHFMEMDFISFGDKAQKGERRVFLEKDEKYVEAIIENGRIRCINILNLFKNSGAVKNFLMRALQEPGTPLDAQMQAVLIKSGLPRELTTILLRGVHHD